MMWLYYITNSILYCIVLINNNDIEYKWVDFVFKWFNIS